MMARNTQFDGDSMPKMLEKKNAMCGNTAKSRMTSAKMNQNVLSAIFSSEWRILRRT